MSRNEIGCNIGCEAFNVRNSSYRNTFRLRLQIVFVIASGVADMDEEEMRAVCEAAPAALRNHRCSIIDVIPASKWASLMLDADPALIIPRAASSLKAVLARRVNAMRGVHHAFWAPGYAIFTVGEAISPEDIAKEIEEKHARAVSPD